jgi:hypothetical protein
VHRSFRLEAKRCAKGSKKDFASERNKGLVLLVSLQSEIAIFACENEMDIKRKIAERNKLKQKIQYWIER